MSGVTGCFWCMEKGTFGEFVSELCHVDCVECVIQSEGVDFVEQVLVAAVPPQQQRLQQTLFLIKLQDMRVCVVHCLLTLKPKPCGPFKAVHLAIQK